MFLKVSTRSGTGIGSGLDWTGLHSFRPENGLAVGYFDYCNEPLGLVHKELRGRGS